MKWIRYLNFYFLKIDVEYFNNKYNSLLLYVMWLVFVGLFVLNFRVSTWGSIMWLSHAGLSMLAHTVARIILSNGPAVLGELLMTMGHTWPIEDLRLHNIMIVIFDKRKYYDYHMVSWLVSYKILCHVPFINN